MIARLHQPVVGDQMPRTLPAPHLRGTRFEDPGRGGRSPTHVSAALTGMMSMPSIIERVRRHVSQTSEAYLPTSKFGG